MTENDCVFCKIVSGDIPSYVIGETDEYRAMLDIAQFTEGHTIVIPKQHYETIWDVPNISEYFEFVKKIGNHFREKGFKYVDTMTFGRMVRHAHVHVVPHNGDCSDWEKALKVIGEYQIDSNRHPTMEEAQKVLDRYSIG